MNCYVTLYHLLTLRPFVAYGEKSNPVKKKFFLNIFLQKPTDSKFLRMISAWNKNIKFNRLLFHWDF